MNKPIIRPASREDIEAFSSARNKPTILAWCMEIDGRIAALGGFAFGKGRWFAFVDLTEEARQYKMTIARAAIRAFEEARRMGIKFVYAEANPYERNSVRWIRSLGFIIDPRSECLYRWSASENKNA